MMRAVFRVMPLLFVLLLFLPLDVRRRPAPSLTSPRLIFSFSNPSPGCRYNSFEF